MDECRAEFEKRFPESVWEDELDGLHGEDLVFAGWKAAWELCRPTDTDTAVYVGPLYVDKAIADEIVEEEPD
jgi:hypothetical protein